jgi:hypothetical protein
MAASSAAASAAAASVDAQEATRAPAAWPAAAAEALGTARERLAALSESLLGELRAEEREALEAERAKLVAALARLEAATQGVRATLSADPELATGAQAVLSEAHALLEELGRDPAAGELVTRGREQLDAALGGLLRDDAASARVVAKLQSKLGENREALQALARDWAPGLLASLNEAVDSSGGLTVAEAVAAVQSRAQAAGVSVRADALLELAGSAPHEQEKQHGAPVTVDMVASQIVYRCRSGSFSPTCRDVDCGDRDAG